ncbi:hypothetical protein FA15DRAFT_342169 [Coprinopsis marcescibilis]|uniref:Uncharacterized protein n=1 Tax=Coprinopsis marcescibilis TaxID=230819 RepID=A0A5C3KCB4_COPMA|nr:hypothetical protein FA15DRAFT_342169 [Coprinopsis marcescibilis]
MCPTRAARPPPPTRPEQPSVSSLVSSLVLLASPSLPGSSLKKQNEKWDANKFRRSALMLDEKDDDPLAPRTPRPPSMVERRANLPPPPSMAYPFSDTASMRSYDSRPAGTPQPYGAPSPFGAPPVPYAGGQNMYNQAPDGYGSAYGAAAGVGAMGAAAAAYRGTPPPHQFQPGYGQPRPYSNYATSNSSHLSQSSAGSGSAAAAAAAAAALTVQNTGANVNRSNTVSSHLPNPFSDQPSPMQPQFPNNVSAPLTRVGGNEGDELAPPAYVDDGTYAKLKRDAKTPVVMNPDTVSAAAARATPAPAAASVSSGSAPDATTTNANKKRPMSSQTFYDPADAYGGM